MNALFISNDPFIWDEGSAVRARLKVYARAIGTLHVISRAPRTAIFVKDGPLSLHPVYGGKLASLLAVTRCARLLVRGEEIDVVSAQDPFEYGFIALLATFGTSAKLHIQIHTDLYSPYFASGKNRIRLALAAITLRAANRIRVVSKRIGDSLRKRYKRLAPVAVIPIGVPDVPPPVALPSHSFMFTLVAVSRLEPEKRLDVVLAALLLVRRRYPNVGLFVIGDGSECLALMRQAARTGLEGHVIFLGYRSDAIGLMQSAQVFVQASAYEGYGLTLIEAARTGLAVVTTEAGVVGDVLVSERDVLTAPVDDAPALASQIVRLIESEPLRSSLVEHARAAVLAHIREYEDQPAEIAADLARTCSMHNTVDKL